jgi:hypothetical protein
MKVIWKFFARVASIFLYNSCSNGKGLEMAREGELLLSYV